MTGIFASCHARVPSFHRHGPYTKFLTVPEMLKRLAAASGIETPTADDLIRLDRKRAGKKLSNEDWESPTDSDARIARMKDGRTRLAYKPEHAVDLDTGAVLAAPVHHADRGDTKTLPETLEETAQKLDAIKLSPTVEAPAELVADKGYHSRDGLKKLHDGPWKTRITEPAPPTGKGGILRWHVCQLWEGCCLVGDGHGFDEVVLEFGLDGGFDFFDLAGEGFDFEAGFGVEQRDARAGAGGVAGGAELVELAVGDEAEDEGVFGVDVGAEGAGEHDAVDFVDAEAVHEQAAAGVEGGLGELDGADVGLGDLDLRLVRLAFVEDVGEGAAFGHDAG